MRDVTEIFYNYATLKVTGDCYVKVGKLLAIVIYLRNTDVGKK